jgi:hypothetical protein
MRETRHIFNRRRSGMTLELVLEEETGGYTVRFHSPPVCADEDFLCDLRRWIRAIGRGWQKRHGKSSGQQTVTAKFSSQQSKGKFKM